MSNAFTACQELGIDTAAPDALQQLWDASTDQERRELFPYAPCWS